MEEYNHLSLCVKGCKWLHLVSSAWRKWARPSAQCLGFLQSRVVNAKKNFLVEIESATPVSTWVIRKRSSFIADMKKVSNGLGRISNKSEYPLQPRPNTEQCPTPFNFKKAEKVEKDAENIWHENKSVHQDQERINLNSFGFVIKLEFGLLIRSFAPFVPQDYLVLQMSFVSDYKIAFIPISTTNDIEILMTISVNRHIILETAISQH